MLVTLFILAVLASVAMPYAEVGVTRSKEIELARGLREVRTAIDQFHEDWTKGKISSLSGVASENGYPKDLNVLIKGVSLVGGKFRRYLRRIPNDPFVTQENVWRKRGYLDSVDSIIWGKVDVYDIASRSERVALNGTLYKDW